MFDDDCFSTLNNTLSTDNTDCGMLINPANGLPMLEGGCIDIAGNPYGTDSSSDQLSMDFDHSDW